CAPCDSGRAARAVPLPGLRKRRDDRPRRGGGRHRTRARVGLARVGVLAVPPHLLAHRLPQPDRSPRRMGLVVRDDATTHQIDYWITYEPLRHRGTGKDSIEE